MCLRNVLDIGHVVLHVWFVDFFFVSKFFFQENKKYEREEEKNKLYEFCINYKGICMNPSQKLYELLLKYVRKVFVLGRNDQIWRFFVFK